jgi:carbonic anhydrase
MQALCCGVDATQEPLLRSWLGYGLSSVEAWKSGTGGVTTPVELAPHNALSQVNVLRQLSHLATYPFIAERVAKGTLHLHGWWFDLHGADVYAFDPQAEKFILIDHT